MRVQVDARVGDRPGEWPTEPAGPFRVNCVAQSFAWNGVVNAASGPGAQPAGG